MLSGATPGLYWTFDVRPTAYRSGERHPLIATLTGGIVDATWTGYRRRDAHGLGQTRDRVQLQLKWVTQAQFAGYYAANAKGFYAAENLDVIIRPGGPDIVPEQVVAAGGAQFGLGWLPSLLATREQGAPLVNIAQVFAFSGMRQLAFKTSGIRGVADLRGRKVAVWFGGNEFPLLSTAEPAADSHAIWELAEKKR